MRYASTSRMAAYRQGIPLSAWYAAKLMAVRAGDCGPCTQLAVDMARAHGVGDALLGALLSDDLDAMGQDAALGHRFAVAVLARDPGIMALRDEVRARWGEQALASLALTISASHMFPTLKYAMGHGQACQQVRVGAQTITPRQAAHA